MAAKKIRTKVIKKGMSRSAGGSGEGGSFLSIKDGESVVFSPLEEQDEILCFDQHSFWEVNPAVHVPCIRDECIPCSLGNEAKYRAFIPVVLKSGETKILSAGTMIVNQLVDIGEEIGGIKGKAFKLSRKGNGLSTRYTVVALGTAVDISKYELPDTVAAVGSTDPEDIAEILRKAGFYAATEASEPVGSDEGDEVDEAW